MAIFKAEEITLTHFPGVDDLVRYPNGEQFFVCRTVDGYDLRTDPLDWTTQLAAVAPSHDKYTVIMDIAALIVVKRDSKTNPVPAAALSTYDQAIAQTCRLLDIRETDRLTPGSHQCVTDWFLEYHGMMRAAYYNIGCMEDVAATSGFIRELRAQRTQSPAFLTTPERVAIAQVSSTSGSALRAIPEQENTIVELLTRSKTTRATICMTVDNRGKDTK